MLFKVLEITTEEDLFEEARAHIKALTDEEVLSAAEIAYNQQDSRYMGGGARRYPTTLAEARKDVEVAFEFLKDCWEDYYMRLGHLDLVIFSAVEDSGGLDEEFLDIDLLYETGALAVAGFLMHNCPSLEEGRLEVTALAKEGEGQWEHWRRRLEKDVRRKNAQPKELNI